MASLGINQFPSLFPCMSRAWNTGAFILGGTGGLLARTLAFPRLRPGLSGMGCTCSIPMTPCFLVSQGPWAAPWVCGEPAFARGLANVRVWMRECVATGVCFCYAFSSSRELYPCGPSVQGAGKESVCLAGSRVKGPTLGLVTEALPKCPSFWDCMPVAWVGPSISSLVRDKPYSVPRLRETLLFPFLCKFPISLHVLGRSSAAGHPLHPPGWAEHQTS